MSARLRRSAYRGSARVAAACSVTVLLACVLASGCGDSPPPWFGGPWGPCDRDVDCPVNSYCIEPDPGYCLVPCRSTLDCGPPYLCASRDRRGSKGKMNVCVPPP